MDVDLEVHHHESAASRRRRWPRSATRCPASASSPPCSASSSRWARSTARRARSATRSARRWSAPSSASCCATASSGRWPRRSSTASIEGSTSPCIKAGVLALARAWRRPSPSSSRAASIPAEVRPTFAETEQFCRAPQADAAGRGRMSPASSRSSSRRRRRGHGGHHGGAWKVAYADFVTAMMAFFLVMWLVGQSKAVKSVGRRLLPRSRHLRPGEVGRADRRRRSASSIRRRRRRAIRRSRTACADGERAALEEHRQAHQAAAGRVAGAATLGKQIEIQITRDGLRIELVDAESQTSSPAAAPRCAAEHARRCSS